MSDLFSNNRVCTFCKKSYKTCLEARKHMLDEHRGSASAKCMKCIHGFSDAKAMLRHQNIHFLYCCNICELNTNSWEYYTEHIRNHRQLEGYVLSWQTGVKLHNCSTCVQGFDNTADLENHLAYDNLESFKDSFVKNKYVLNKYNNVKQYCTAAFTSDLCLDESGNKFNLCKFCNQRFQHIKVHMRVHFNKDHLLCIYCKIEFPLHKSNELIKHAKTHVGSRPYLCRICGLTYRSTAELRCHLTIHSDRKRTYICKICTKGFYKKQDLDDHTSTHGNNVVCPVCQRTFLSRRRLAIHARFHLDEQRYACPVCGKCFTYKNSLLRHRAVHSNTKPHICHICGRGFSHLYNFQGHLTTHSKEKNFSCNLCQKRFSRKEYLRTHMRVHTKEKPFKCNLCDLRFSSNSGRRSHQQSHNVLKKYRCDKCDEFFSSPATLKCHKINKHNEDNPFICNICNGKFPSRKALRADQKKHKEEGPHDCNECLKYFPSYEHYRRHMTRTHRRTYICEVCHEGFGDEPQLSKHKLTHKGKGRPSLYSCKSCTKKFKTLHTLKVHMNREHSEVYRSVCVICNSEFASISALRLHQRIHKEQDQKYCKECLKDFASYEQYSAHMRSVHGPRNYICEVCPKSFQSKAKLSIHKLSHKRMERPSGYACKSCKVKFKTLNELTIHDCKCGDDLGLFPCELCEKMYTTFTKLEIHMAGHSVGNGQVKSD